MVKQYIKAFTLPRRCGVVTKIILAAGFLLCAGTSAVRADNALEPAAILAVMQRVADWQLANPATNPPAGWVQAAGDAGLMALAGISGDAKYRDAMLAMGETNGGNPARANIMPTTNASARLTRNFIFSTASRR